MKRKLLFLCMLLSNISLFAQAQLLERTITVDGLERDYLLYVPAAYDGSEAWPLVFNLHGATGNPMQQVVISDMNVVADTAHFLIAYPAGISNPEMTDTGWNDGLFAELPNDVKFIENIIDVAQAEYNIDLARVYAAGLSNGGGMSFTLACELADRLAAIASVAGPGLLDCNPEPSVPILLMHGTADLIVPFAGGTGIFVPTEFPAVRDRIQYWIDKNNCQSEPAITDFTDLNTADSSTVTLERYTDCDDDFEFAFYQIDNGGHTWPGGSPTQIPPGFEPFLGNINYDIHASSEIWNFFNRHVHPNPAQPQLLQKTITVDGLEREYLLYVPAAYDGSENWPLLLNLHPATFNATVQIGLSQMNPVADTAHFLIAYPNGVSVNGNPNMRNWNPLLLPDRADDITFLTNLIDTLLEDLQIDPNRIYITGVDEGGLMSYTFVCQQPNQVAAIASVAGIIPTGFDISGCVPASPRPLLHMHGTADLLIPFDGGLDGVGNIAPPTRSVIENWINNNGCASDSTVVNFEDIVLEDNSTVSRREFTNCNTYIGADEIERNLEVWFYVIENGGHNWPGGAPAPPGFEAFFGNINRDINASSEIWNFFNRHELAQATSVKAATPEAFDLEVFPNPFSEQVTFQFKLPKSARVLLTLHNAIGQQVKTLYDGQLPQGEQRFNWRNNDLPEGAYFYRLRVNDQVVSRPMILSRP